MNDLSASHLAAQGGAFEEQRGNNAILRIFDLAENVIVDRGEHLITLSLQSFPLPVTTVEALETNFLNEKRKIAGIVTFEDMEVMFKDFVDMRTARVLKLWHEKVYDPVTGRIGLARNYKKRGEIELFGPNQQFHRFWSCIGMFPTTFNAGQIDMASAEPVKISLTISMDKCYASRAATAVNLVPTI
jgi:hypothetical protein